MPKTPKLPKMPPDFSFSGEAGEVLIAVDPIPDGGGYTLTFGNGEPEITIEPGVSGSRFAKEFYKFATKVLAYASQGKLPKEV